MRLGLLPALGGGIRELARTGQAARLLDVAPAALSNLARAYNPDYGTLDTRDNGLGSLNAEVVVCGALAQLGRVDVTRDLPIPNPLDPHYGLSPLQANALAVDANTELLKSRCHTFAAGPRPGIVLSSDQVLTDQTLARLEERTLSKFAGRQHWHRPLVLEQGLRASPWTLTPAEMDFANSARLTREEILAAFRVPPPITGLVENLGLGADIWLGARVMFCEGTVQPKLDLIGQSLTRDLGRRFGPDVAVAFPDCSPRNPAERRADDELDARLGLRTFNEIRRSRGLEPYADPRFDRPILPGEAKPPRPSLEVPS